MIYSSCVVYVKIIAPDKVFFKHLIRCRVIFSIYYKKEGYLCENMHNGFVI